MPAGWRLGNRSYSQQGSGVMPRGGVADYVVTRPEGYVPYQSVVQPDGRYAYNANQDRYPQTQNFEQRAGRQALSPTARQTEFLLNRWDNYVHWPDEAVEMGINYSQMRTQPMPDAAFPPPNVDGPRVGLDQRGRLIYSPMQGPLRDSRDVMAPPPLPYASTGERGAGPDWRFPADGSVGSGGVQR